MMNSVALTNLKWGLDQKLPIDALKKINSQVMYNGTTWHIMFRVQGRKRGY